MAEILGIDVGGTGIKAAIVDTDAGQLITDRQRVDTPHPSTPENVAAAVSQLVADIGYSGRVGCCFPAVVIDGKAKTASNIDRAWLETDVDATFQQATGLPFTVLNDADAAGLAEMRFGAGAGLRGTVVMVTIGTGLGSGIFHNGQLIPNSELGRMPGKDGKPVEIHASNRARTVNELSWDEWGPRFNDFLEQVNRLLWPDHIILGGGVSKKFERYKKSIKVPAAIHVAKFENNAGIIGAAVAADEAQNDFQAFYFAYDD